MDVIQLFQLYSDHLHRQLLPFWMKAADRSLGGVYTCFDNEGSKLVSNHKYTWSQGRWLWLLARLAIDEQHELIYEDRNELLRMATATADFLKKHVLLDNGNCAYLLTDDGKPLEAFPGSGLDSSFYADCFVVLGFAEYARAIRDESAVNWAYQRYERIAERVSLHDLKCEPYPIPEGYRAHSVSMIMLNVSQVLAEALQEFGHPGIQKVKRDMGLHLQEIMEFFLDAQTDTIRELIPEREQDHDTRLARHLNPGHALECMWFVMDAAEALGQDDYVHKATQVIGQSFDMGWDEEYGGLLRFVDRDGGKPRGREAGSRYEQLIADTWDMKLWWPHSEALYALLRAYYASRDRQFLDRYQKLHDYVFQTFPNGDKSIGEWIQIRDRQGKPMQKLVALPVKDPYHIIRNVILIMELLSDKMKDMGLSLRGEGHV